MHDGAATSSAAPECRREHRGVCPVRGGDRPAAEPGLRADGLSDPGGLLFLVATAAFAGAFVYQRSLAEEPIGDRFAAGGIVGGFLAFGCPICNAVLLALFSSSALMTYFEPLRPILGVVSVACFAALLVYQRRRCEVC